MVTIYILIFKKIILTNKNINNFFNLFKKNKKYKKETDLYIGFFGYEILCNFKYKINNQKN